MSLLSHVSCAVRVLGERVACLTFIFVCICASQVCGGWVGVSKINIFGAFSFVPPSLSLMHVCLPLVAFFCLLFPGGAIDVVPICYGKCLCGSHMSWECSCEAECLHTYVFTHVRTDYIAKKKLEGVS